MKQVISIVFSKINYIILAAIIFVGLFISLSLLTEYIFLEPYLIMHVPLDRMFGFILIIAVSGMSGLVLSMNVYRIRIIGNNVKKIGSGFLGSTVGAATGGCSCGPVGFAIISTFGTVGGIATAFIANYEMPLRLTALAILGYAYYTTTKALSLECKIKN